MDISKLLLNAILLPMFGAGLMWLLAPLGRSAVRIGALCITLLTLVAAGTVVFSADGALGTEFAVWGPFSWVSDSLLVPLDIQLSLGLDGLSIWLFGLSALLMLTAVLVSWEAIEEQPALYYGMLLLLECGCLGVFAARDIILFYVFFEFTLIPLFFLIGIWGSEERRHAATKFFLFTLAGSVLTFVGLLSIVLWHGFHLQRGALTFSIPQLTMDLRAAAVAGQGMPLHVQLWVFLALAAGFAIKVPLVPFHTWLPLAHVQAPTAGSVFLAGVLLKMGTYGFLRFSIPLLPDASVRAMPVLLWLAVIGILYGALVALAQTDMKRLIAYSSVSHLGFVVLGMFALNQIAIRGATLQMVNHGLSTGALFALIGMLYERYHTREIADLSGIARRLPLLSFFMLLFTFSSIGLPGLNGFVGEFLILVGMFERAWADAPPPWRAQFIAIAVLSLSGVVLGAWYMLWLVQRIFFGPLREPAVNGEHHAVRDLNIRECLALLPLAVPVVWIGLFPNQFLSRMDGAIIPIAAVAQDAVTRSQVVAWDSHPEHLAAGRNAARDGARASTTLARRRPTSNSTVRVGQLGTGIPSYFGRRH